MSSCPNGYFAYSPTMECLSICPINYYGHLPDKTCIQDCSPLYANDMTNMCVNICPNTTTASNNSYRCQ